jgi:hypothetical protein
MRFPSILAAVGLLVITSFTGCNGSSPAQIASNEPAEKPKQFEIKDLDGLWLLKSSATSSENGVYSTSPKAGNELALKMSEGVTEMRKGKGSWTKYATISLGTEPNCLLVTKPDISGQQMVLRLRYKLEGSTLITVQDNLYPDILPDSFQMENAVDRQRQMNTYVKTER